MSVEQIDAVEDLAAACEPDSRATVGSVGSDPLAAAAHEPDEVHGFKSTAAVRELVADGEHRCVDEDLVLTAGVAARLRLSSLLS
jgi:hypothetical protein